MRDGWVQTTLGEVADVIDPHPSHRAPAVDENGIPFIGIGDLRKTGDIDFAKARRVSRDILEEHKSRYDRSEFLIGLGRVASIGMVVRLPDENIEYVVSPTLAVIKAREVIGQFLFYLLEGPHSQEQFQRFKKGSTRESVGMQILRKIKVQLPPLPEQKRIVDLISSVDSYIEALQQQLESAKRSRNAVLHELLTKGGDDWVETTLGEAAEVIMGRQLSPSKKLGTRPRPYIRAANIGSWGINLEDIYEMDFTEIEEERFACQVGDTILVEGGNEKSVGCPALITETESGLCIQNTVIRSRSKNSKVLDPNFQYHLLRFMFWRGDFAQLCAGTTIMHLGQKRAEVVSISIPPLKEQLNIVDTISKFDSAVNYSEETLNSARSLRSGLLSDLLSGKHEIPESYDKVMGAA